MSGMFTIQLNGLREGRHTIDFEIGKKFFEEFEDSEVKEGSLIANVEMDKRSSHIDLLIRVSGSVKVCCDRCLEMFFHHDINGKSTCDPLMLEKLDELRVDDENESDARWDELKKLMNNN